MMEVNLATGETNDTILRDASINLYFIGNHFFLLGKIVK